MVYVDSTDNDDCVALLGKEPRLLDMVMRDYLEFVFQYAFSCVFSC